MITVMMLAQNEYEIIKSAVQSFRLFSDIDLSFIIVDNASTDGLQEWALEQTDLTYVRPDEEPIGWGKAVNMVKRELHIDTDLLVIRGNYMLTPYCLFRMVEVLHREDSTGGVCGRIMGQVCYEEAVKLANSETNIDIKRVMKLNDGAVIWRKEALEEIGEFEERLQTWSKVVDDYCLRMIQADKNMFICSNALFWSAEVRDRMENTAEDTVVLNNKWGMHYFNEVYSGNIIAWFDDMPNREMSVLEIGCDCGATLMEIKNRYPNAQVYGTEINPQAAAIAAHFAQVKVNDIEEKNLPFKKGSFDYIIFGDVLEHLHNPLETLKYCKDFLSDEGSVLASIPNLMHISVIEQLLRGNFSYTEMGLLDKTHIHLFTYNEIVRLFSEAGYEICHMCSCSYAEISNRQKQMIDALLNIDKSTQRFMYETYQYSLKAKKKGINNE